MDHRARLEQFVVSSGYVKTAAGYKNGWNKFSMSRRMVIRNYFIWAVRQPAVMSAATCTHGMVALAGHKDADGQGRSVPQ